MRNQRGFSLLEIQLATILLSLGLGMVSMAYLHVAKVTTQVYHRQIAQFVIQQMVAVLPSYKQQLSSLEYNVVGSQEGEVKECFAGILCSKTEMLRAWRQEWNDNVQTLLPQGSLQLRCVSHCIGNQKLYIRITWQSENTQTMPSSERSSWLSTCVVSKCLEVFWTI